MGSLEKYLDILRNAGVGFMLNEKFLNFCGTRSCNGISLGKSNGGLFVGPIDEGSFLINDELDCRRGYFIREFLEVESCLDVPCPNYVILDVQDRGGKNYSFEIYTSREVMMDKVGSANVEFEDFYFPDKSPRATM